MEPFVPEPEVVSEYRALAAGKFADGALGRLLIVVSTDDLNDSKGDLYVALGLTKYLRRLGWGITLWPTGRWGEETPEGMDAAIVMIESFVPGLVRDETRLIAWVRNWTDTWVSLPFLDTFAAVWCSSEASADEVRRHFVGAVEVLPLGTDPELFHPVETSRRDEVVTTANFWGVGRALIESLSDLASTEAVTWFGKNARFLQIPEQIDHRHTIDYFSLPWVYSQWQYVIDDVIPAAAKYGSQNSRLFDALACGALVVTNTEAGLADLGLGEVAVYGDGSTLGQTIGALRTDPDAVRERAARLSAIVTERHSYAMRADVANGYLTTMLAAARTEQPRTPTLRFATNVREQLRASETYRDSLQVALNDVQHELDVSLALNEQYRRQWGVRVTRYARLAVSPVELRERIRARRAAEAAVE